MYLIRPTRTLLIITVFTLTALISQRAKCAETMSHLAQSAQIFEQQALCHESLQSPNAKLYSLAQKRIATLLTESSELEGYLLKLKKINENWSFDELQTQFPRWILTFVRGVAASESFRNHTQLATNTSQYLKTAASKILADTQNIRFFEALENYSMDHIIALFDFQSRAYLKSAPTEGYLASHFTDQTQTREMSALVPEHVLKLIELGYYERAWASLLVKLFVETENTRWN